jgi:hypothetical protein
MAPEFRNEIILKNEIADWNDSSCSDNGEYRTDILQAFELEDMLDFDSLISDFNNLKL